MRGVGLESRLVSILYFQANDSKKVLSHISITFMLAKRLKLRSYHLRSIFNNKTEQTMNLPFVYGFSDFVGFDFMTNSSSVHVSFENRKVEAIKAFLSQLNLWRN